MNYSTPNEYIKSINPNCCISNVNLRLSIYWTLAIQYFKLNTLKKTTTTLRVISKG